MQKQFTPLLSVIAVAFLLMTGCGKDDPPPAPAKTKTELISQGSWKFQSANSSLLGDISNNPLLACYVDNVMTFSTNGTGGISEGTVSCSTALPSSFTWAFQTNETLLHLNFTLFPGGSPDFTINSLTESNLVLSQQVTQAPYPTQTITVTFKH
ncbi:MAG TPA: lipocalin family protein [Chitinophagaceae bacterium]|nr:lipocalin family protein [Chitinophagaceae bacterium]